MENMFLEFNNKADCREVVPVWIVLAANNPVQSEVEIFGKRQTHHTGYYRMRIEETVLQREEIRTTGTVNQTSDQALMLTLVRAFEDLESRMRREWSVNDQHPICISLQILSTSQSFLNDIRTLLKGSEDEYEIGSFDRKAERTVKLLKLVAKVDGLLVSNTELREIGRAIDPVEQIRLYSSVFSV